MKKLIKLMSFALALTLTASVAAGTVVTGADYDEPIVEISDSEYIGGTCGENVTWVYNSGTLTISGIGDMSSYKGAGLSSPFSTCKIDRIIINNGVTSVGDYVFYNCTDLKSITIPGSVTYIGERAIASCINLDNLIIPDSVTYIGTQAFGLSYALKSFSMPDSVTYLGESAFGQCSALETIKLSNNITSINNNVFYYCKSLKKLTIPDKVTSIGVGAFSYCSSLESINIPAGITSIGGMAFYECTNLTDIYFAGTEKQWNAISKTNSSIPKDCTIHFKSSETEEKTVKSITLTAPTKTEYIVGDVLDLTGGKILVTYSDRSTNEIGLTAAMCTGFDSTKTGKQTITVYYEGKTAKFTVTVKAKEKPSTDIFEIGSADYPTIASAIAQINKDIKAKSAKPAYTMNLSDGIEEKKAISLPAVPVTITADSAVTITVPSITAKGDLTLENVTLKTAKGANAAVTAKKALTVTNCTLGTVKAAANLTVTDSTFDALTASGKAGTAATLGGTIVINKALTVSNDLIVTDGADLTVNGKFAAKGAISFGAIKAFTVKNGK